MERSIQSAYWRALRIGALVSACGMFTAGSAQAVLISSATSAGTYARDCRTAADIAAGLTVPTMCESSPTQEFVEPLSGGGIRNTRVEAQTDVQLGGTMASATALHPYATSGTNVTLASVDASGGTGVSALRQGAWTSQPYARVSSHTTALQSYAWSGSGSATRTITGAVDFTSLNLMDFADFNALSTAPASLVSASLSVFSLATDSFDVDPSTALAFARFEGAAATRGDYLSEFYDLQSSILGTSYTFSHSFTMTAGRTYFVESWLGLWSRYGGWVDATHTYLTTIEDMTGLTAAVPSDAPVIIRESVLSVPTPSSAVLFALGVVAVWWRRRVRGV